MGILAPVRKAFRFGYDFITPKGRRRAPDGVLKSEDQELHPTERRKLISGAREVQRNVVIGQWAVRRHLDYVSTFSFQAKIGGDADDQLERLMRGWAVRGACDVGGRHSLARIVRMMEARRVVDGDCFLMRLASGQLQAIEGDRIRTPLGGLPGQQTTDPARLVHGVHVDDVGKALAYCVCKRARASDFAPSAGAFEFERLVSADNLFQHAWYERFDQIRGISPMAAAFGTLQDLNEGFTYALAKMKIAQLFGLFFYREQADQVGEPMPVDGETTDKYEVDLGSGPIKVELDAGDRAEFLESKNPSTEFQAFSQTMIGVALKALDIPFSFYAEDFTNYSGARQALLQYQLSCELKRADVVELLNWITRWRILLWIESGELQADPDQVAWEWVPKGIPWIDPLKEVQADVQAIGAGLLTRTRALKEQGADFYEVIDELAREVEYMKKKGLDPSIKASANIVTLEQAA